MVDRTDEVLRDAISETDKDIFNAAFGEKPEDEVLEVEAQDEDAGDESADESGQETEGEAEGEEEQPAEAKTEDGDKPTEEKAKPEKPEPEGKVPAGVHRQEKERARAAEAERDTLKTERDELKKQLESGQAQSRKDVDELRTQLAKVTGALEALSRQKPNGEAKPESETVPDIFENPTGFADFIKNGFKSEISDLNRALANQRVETSMAIAHALHKDAFEAGLAALQKLNPQNPDDQVTVRRIYASPNPGQALIEWHNRNEALREVGSDPSAYKAKVREEAIASLKADPDFRKQLLADLRAEATAGNNGRPNTITNLPPSLSRNGGGRAASSETVTYPQTESDIFDAAFAK